MILLRITAIIVLFLAQFGAFCQAAEVYKVEDLFVDSSDRIILIKGKGSFKNSQTLNYSPSSNPNNINLINSLAIMKLQEPARYVLDIPNAILIGSSRDYALENSKTIKNIKLSQFSTNPNIVRVVITLNNTSDIAKFKTYTDGTNIIIKYNSEIITNSIQYKFYTPSGDMDKSIVNQNTGALVTYAAEEETKHLSPTLQAKYHLSRIDKNSDGLILRGIGSISLQKVSYNQDNTKAVAILDNATLSQKLENASFTIPSSQKDLEAYATISRLSSKKIQIVLQGNNLKDFRFVISQDAQSMFISHRGYVLNTMFSSSMASVVSYNTSKTANGYRLFDFSFNRGITYDVFELNDNFYIDIDNLPDYSKVAFESVFKDLPLSAMKIAGDKTRYIISTKNLKFSYANIESNSKSIKLCFKEIAPQAKQEPVVAIADTQKEPVIKSSKDESGNINVTYIPKGEDNKIKKPKSKKEEAIISSMRKVVLDPGHGGADCGAIALDNKYFEKTINLEVAKLIQQKLLKKDIHVYMTREKDETLTLEDRVNYANEINPDIYVSIHANSTLQSDRYGLEVHYYKDDSLELADVIHKNFANEKNVKKWETKDRGVIKSRFYVINHTEMPAVLIEIGFISNKIERDKLDTKERKEQIADSIAKGILDYMKVK